MKISLRTCVFLLLLFGIPIGTWHLILRPRKMANDAQLQQINSKYSKLQELNCIRGMVTTHLEEEIAALKNAITVLNNRVPREEETDKILRGVSMLANANRLRTQKIQANPIAAPTTPGTRYLEQHITVELEGDFLGFYTFLQALENQPRIIRVVRMKLEKLADPTMKGQVKASLDMQLYIHSPQEEKI